MKPMLLGFVALAMVGCALRPPSGGPGDLVVGDTRRPPLPWCSPVRPWQAIDAKRGTIGGDHVPL